MSEKIEPGRWPAFPSANRDSYERIRLHRQQWRQLGERARAHGQSSIRFSTLRRYAWMSRESAPIVQQRSCPEARMTSVADPMEVAPVSGRANDIPVILIVALWFRSWIVLIVAYAQRIRSTRPTTLYWLRLQFRFSGRVAISLAVRSLAGRRPESLGQGPAMRSPDTETPSYAGQRSPWRDLH